jgi:hypothetical protein
MKSAHELLMNIHEAVITGEWTLVEASGRPLIILMVCGDQDYCQDYRLSAAIVASIMGGLSLIVQ